MKHSAKIFLFLALLSLSLVTCSDETTFTKSFSTTKTSPDNSEDEGNHSGTGSGSNPSSSNNEEDAGSEVEGQHTGIGPSSGPQSANSGSNNEETPVAELSSENRGAEAFQACDPDNRQQVCTLEYLPVCGYIHNCEGGACTQSFGNDCSACAQSNVDGFVDGACEDVRNVCDPDDRPDACPLNYLPTCAVAGNCFGSNCFRNVGNGCEACSLQGVAYSLPGACPPYERAQRTFCDVSNRPEVCTADYTPVCAHVIDCVGNSCYFTAGNACSACGDATVNWHTPGECDPNESRTYCDPNNRPEVCTLDYTPVCAHRENCEGDGDDCFFTAGNACGACGDATVNWHYPGECPGDDGDNDDEDEDDRTYCDPDQRPEICTADYTPVCAHRAGCEGDDDDCSFTAGNACSACGDATVNWQTPGEC